MSDKRTTSMRANEDTIRMLRIIAAVRGMSIQDVFEHLIREEYERVKQEGWFEGRSKKEKVHEESKT